MSTQEARPSTFHVELKVGSTFESPRDAYIVCRVVKRLTARWSAESMDPIVAQTCIYNAQKVSMVALVMAHAYYRWTWDYHFVDLVAHCVPYCRRAQDRYVKEVAKQAQERQLLFATKTRAS